MTIPTATKLHPLLDRMHAASSIYFNLTCTRGAIAVGSVADVLEVTDAFGKKIKVKRSNPASNSATVRVRERVCLACTRVRMC